jgi:hyperosmotically inducible periplasmic protein
MRTYLRLSTLVAPVLLAGLLTGCAPKPVASPDVKDSVKSALDSRGLKDVSVDQDREKGVVTLKGKVATEADKTAAAAMTQQIAGNQVVANEITVEPPGMESDARKVRNALDDGIDSNVKALFVQLKDVGDVKYDVNNAVVTLTGEVTSQAKRSEVESAVKNVPNVRQVVNELQVKNQKATGRGGL